MQVLCIKLWERETCLFLLVCPLPLPLPCLAPRPLLPLTVLVCNKNAHMYVWRKTTLVTIRD